MDTSEWGKIAQTIEAYRACPEQSQFESLCDALSDCTLYVPVGDFDGNNAVISPLTSVQGGTFIPLYATADNAPENQHTEGVRPADWQHILSQMSSVEGYVIEPYSANFAFDRRFIDALLCCVSAEESLDEGEAGEVDVPAAQESPEENSGEVVEAQAPAVHAWPPALNDDASAEENAGDNAEQSATEDDIEDADTGAEPQGFFDAFASVEPDSAESESAESESAESDLAESESVDSSSAEPDSSAGRRVGIPNHLPGSLHDAMQAVSDELTVPVWLFEVQDEGGSRSYLMVLDTSVEWFDACGPDAVNRVLARFPDPGVPLDFGPRESELGRYIEGQEPHYRPYMNTAVRNRLQINQNEKGSGQSFLRRLFKR